MRKVFFLFAALLSSYLYSQKSEYSISFENAVHHEAQINATFSGITNDVLLINMSRSSPGRYALHEFVKNIYAIKAYDSKGNILKVERPNPYQWKVSGHDGTVKVSYTLFGNRGDGTYSQIDETHAHLNIPATFIYAPDLFEAPVEVTFNVREDLNWKVATQLKHVTKNTYSAPNIYYFMDSPTEISNYSIREFKEESNRKIYNIRFVLHHHGTDSELDEYFEKVKKIVKKEKEVYGELPDFDFGEYTFLACYIGNVDGDGMEHRNSTILTDKEGLAEGGMQANIGTVSHEFFHSWNVERIRPKSLEPFDFQNANMSGSLWFAEGFTSYYTNLILCRAGIISALEYVKKLNQEFNYVWNSPARQFFNPIEMSYQAPFVDAATSVDPNNRDNTFISYYTYGSVLGLALDLSLRNQKEKLNLDDFMKQIWEQYGKSEKPYTIEDIKSVLTEYAGSEFAENFFSKYIYNSQMPDYKTLFASVGLHLTTDDKKAFLGVAASEHIIIQNTKMNTPAYKAGLDKGDKIISINGIPLKKYDTINNIIKTYQPDDEIKIVFIRNGIDNTTALKLEKDPTFIISLYEKNGLKVKKSILRKRDEWLK